ncbi:MAG: MFS transporter [Acidovorax sp.]
MNPYAPRPWLPHERPKLPGSPATPLHPPHIRAAYAAVGFIVSITGGLSNALVNANLQDLQGALGASAVDVAWLPAAYVMTNVSMNLLLVKFRQEFGLRLFTEAFLILYALVALAHLFVNDIGSAIAVRAAHGMTGAALSTLGLYYTMQAFPLEWRPRGMAVGLGLSSLALPLARVLPVSLLEFAEWRGLYLFELGLCLLSLGCVLLLKLPPSDRLKAFEKLDFVTFMLFAPGMALLCAVLALGRTVWWLEAPWLGWSLAGAIVLLTAAMLIEHNRRNPLINTRWWGSGDMLSLGLVMVLIRIVLSEQSTGAVGFLQALGMRPDQMHGLFWCVLAASVAGLAFSALTLNREHLTWPVVVALLVMLAGALIDAHATNLTGPAQMMFSQSLMGFGSMLFLGPAFLSRMGSVVQQPKNLVSFSVLFSISQNLGGQIGAALVGTLQTVREKFHSSQLNEGLTMLDPQVVARLQAGANAYARVLTDPALRSVRGNAALAAAASREAAVLAYNDVFLAIAGVSAATLLVVLGRALWRRLNRPSAVVAPPQAPVPSSSPQRPMPLPLPLQR